MRLLHRTILASLPGPFFAAFGTLVFLLLMQFLIKHLPDLVGRGLPVGAVLELVAYSLSYMVVLAVPMSVLIAALAAFGRLAESRAYAVVKSAGVGLVRLTWPAFAAAALVAGFMLHFNNVLLPEANYRMKGLWNDIRDAKPGFQLEPGVFYDGVQNYHIRVGARDPETDAIADVLVLDESQPGTKTAVVAAEGRLRTAGDRLVMTLRDGEIHRLKRVRENGENVERYERVAFQQHRMRLDLSDLSFERRDQAGDRTDRTMPTADMVRLVDSLDAEIAERRAELVAELTALADPAPLRPAPLSSPPAPPPPAPLAPDAARPAIGGKLAQLIARPDTGRAEGAIAAAYGAEGEALAPSNAEQDSAASAMEAPDTAYAGRPVLVGLSAAQRERVISRALTRTRQLRASADAGANALRWEQQRADGYRVEVHKKVSMAVACVVFMLIGIPLGLRVPRSGFGRTAVTAVLLFLFYWATLNQGEKLADRGMLTPWVGMWAANLITGAVGVWLFAREAREPAPFFRSGGKRPPTTPAAPPS